MSYPDPSSVESIDAAAAAWLARLDRGLTPTEQDEYLVWRSRSPLHSAAVDRLRQSWVALDSLAAWRPAHSPQPNPDLLVVKRARRIWILPAVGLAAAVIVIAAFRFPVVSTDSPTASTTRPSPNPAAVVTQERRILEDGSIVELNRAPTWLWSFPQPSAVSRSSVARHSSPSPASPIARSLFRRGTCPSVRWAPPLT